MTQTVEERLAQLAELHRERHAAYGDSTMMFGHVVAALFPNGIAVQDARAANRLALVFHLVDKLVRYVNNFDRGGHVDSLDDISVYAQILQRHDATGRVGRPRRSRRGDGEESQDAPPTRGDGRDEDAHQ